MSNYVIRQLTDEEREYVLHNIKSYCKCENPSENTIKAVYILNRLYLGLHHCYDVIHRLTPKDCADPYFLKVTIYGKGGLATWDFDQLTRLVIMAHELCMRVEITSCNMQYLHLAFSQRETREGDICKRHPSIEEAVERVRANW